MSQINLANWEIIDDTANSQIVIRSQNTGEELQFDESATLSISGGGSLGKTNEEIEDVINALLTAGSNVNLSYDDANNSLTVSVPQAGAFVDDDSDNIAELLTTFNGIQLGDDVQIEFGANSDMELQYNSTNDDLRITDATNTNDILALDRTTGDLSVAGTLKEGATL